MPLSTLSVVLLGPGVLYRGSCPSKQGRKGGRDGMGGVEGIQGISGVEGREGMKGRMEGIQRMEGGEETYEQSRSYLAFFRALPASTWGH